MNNRTLKKTKLRRTFACLLVLQLLFIVFFVLSKKSPHVKTTLKNNSYKHNVNTEWQRLTPSIFLRLQTAVFIVDEKKLSIYATCSHNEYNADMNFLKFIFSVNLYADGIYNNSLASHIYLPEVHNFVLIDGMPMNIQLYAYLDLALLKETESLQLPAKTSMTLQVSVREGLKVWRSPLPIPVVVKNRYEPRSEAVYFCAEPSYMAAKDVTDLAWFVQMSRLVGFTRVVIHNNSIVNTREFEQLFRVNQDLVHVVQYNYLPNLVWPQDNRSYFAYLDELAPIGGSEWSEDSLKYVLRVDNMAFNECLCRNSDKARLILVADLDETFVPVRLAGSETRKEIVKLLLQSRLERKEDVVDFEKKYLSRCLLPNNTATFLQSYLSGLYAKFRIQPDSSLYFPQVLYLKDELAEEIFTQLGTCIMSEILNFVRLHFLMHRHT